MMRGITRWAHCALAVCVATVFLGCDDFGEKQALDVQAETSAMRAAGTGGSDASMKLLEGVASSSGTGPAVIQAQQSLGQVQLAKARIAAVDLAKLEASASQTVFRIGQLARQARTSLVLAANYKQLDPKASVEQIADVAAKARGDGNVANYPVDATQIPSLAVAQQNKSRLDGEVAKAQDSIATATKQRDELLAAAGKASSTIESQTGDARGETVKQIADLHAKAAVASKEISDLTATLARAQADQVEQAALVTQLQTAVESMAAQGTSLTQGWQALTAKATDQTNLAKKIVEGEGESIKSLTKTLNEQLKEIDAKRSDVTKLFDDAVASFASAANKAGARVQVLNTAKAESKGVAYATAAWDAEASTIAVDRMNIEKAAAQKGLADLYAAQAKWLAGVLGTTDDVEKVSELLNVGAADPFNGDKMRGELTKALTSANDAYAEVIAILDGVNLQSADLAALKPTKAMTRIVTFSDNAALADLAASSKVAPAVASKAKDLRENMRAAATEARESNVSLPNLPESMGGLAPSAMNAATDASAAPAAAADSPQTAEVRQSIRDLVAKFSSGDVSEALIDETMGRIKLEETLKPVMTEVRGAVLSFVNLRAAVKEKFGDEGIAELMKNDSPGAGGVPAKVPTPEEIEKQIATLKITAVDENTVTIAPTAANGTPAKLVKEVGVWKLDLTEVPPQVSMVAAMAGPMIKPAAGAIDSVTADVQSGKLTSVADVKAALNEALKKSFGGMMGGGGAMPNSEPAAPTEAPPAAPAETTPAPAEATPAPAATATPAAPAEGAGAGGR